MTCSYHGNQLLTLFVTFLDVDTFLVVTAVSVPVMAVLLLVLVLLVTQICVYWRRDSHIQEAICVTS